MGFKSVLYDVLPNIIFDYVSYSSYESINKGDPYAALVADLNTIRDVVGSNAIILGELGFDRRGEINSDVTRTAQVMAAALSW